MCYMWNGELRRGNHPNPVIKEYYKNLFAKWLISEKDKRGFVKYKDE